MARQNEVVVLWVPAHKGITGNELTDGLAKEEVKGRHRDFLDVPNQVRWQASLSHLARRATAKRPRDMAQWAVAHVRPERRYFPPGRTGLRYRQLHRVRKSSAGQYYQLLSGHATIWSFLHERVAGP